MLKLQASALIDRLSNSKFQLQPSRFKTPTPTPKMQTPTFKVQTPTLTIETQALEAAPKNETSEFKIEGRNLNFSYQT